MLSMTVPIGGALALLAVMLLTLSSAARKGRVRNALVLIAVFAVVIAGWGYLRVLRDDNREHEALMNERKHLCGNVARSLDSHQNRFLRDRNGPTWTEHKAALAALENEVSATWRMCVRAESECGAMSPANVIDGSGDQLKVVQRCFEQGPPALESARWSLED